MDVREARGLFPATERAAYFDTAAVGLASRALIDACRREVDGWREGALDFVRGETAGERARAAVAGLIGADAADVALIASVSAAAGLVAAQFGPAAPGQNVVIGGREYSSNELGRTGAPLARARLSRLARHQIVPTVLRPARSRPSLPASGRLCGALARAICQG
jgi:selenocysteine lyase/cysteine desulfurase